jgi:hypothetical protein
MLGYAFNPNISLSCGLTGYNAGNPTVCNAIRNTVPIFDKLLDAPTTAILLGLNILSNCRNFIGISTFSALMLTQVYKYTGYGDFYKVL